MRKGSNSDIFEISVFSDSAIFSWDRLKSLRTEIPKKCEFAPFHKTLSMCSLIAFRPNFGKEGGKSANLLPQSNVVSDLFFKYRKSSFNSFGSQTQRSAYTIIQTYIHTDIYRSPKRYFTYSHSLIHSLHWAQEWISTLMNAFKFPKGNSNSLPTDTDTDIQTYIQTCSMSACTGSQLWAAVIPALGSRSSCFRLLSIFYKQIKGRME